MSIRVSIYINYDKNVSPPAWTGLPSASPVPDPLDSKDFYVLFPRKTILPDQTQLYTVGDGYNKVQESNDLMHAFIIFIWSATLL